MKQKYFFLSWMGEKKMQTHTFFFMIDVVQEVNSLLPATVSSVFVSPKFQVQFPMEHQWPARSWWHGAGMKSKASGSRWFSARLQYLQCVSNGDTAILHKTINLSHWWVAIVWIALLSNGSTAFKLKPYCHWIKGLKQHNITLVTPYKLNIAIIDIQEMAIQITWNIWRNAQESSYMFQIQNKSTTPFQPIHQILGFCTIFVNCHQRMAELWRWSIKVAEHGTPFVPYYQHIIPPITYTCGGTRPQFHHLLSCFSCKNPLICQYSGTS